MRKDTRTRDQLINEIDRLRRGATIEEVGLTLRALIMAGAVAFVAWCGKEAIAFLAGLQTNAHIAVSILGKVEVAAMLSMAFGAGGILYGFSQRVLRKKTVRRLQARIQDFERRIDPRRSGSMLTPDGNTNPEDT